MLPAGLLAVKTLEKPLKAGGILPGYSIFDNDLLDLALTADDKQN